MYRNQNRPHCTLCGLEIRSTWGRETEHPECVEAAKVAELHCKPGMSEYARYQIFTQCRGFAGRVARGARKVEAAHTRAATALSKANMRGQDASRFRFTFEAITSRHSRGYYSPDELRKIGERRAQVYAKLTGAGLADRMFGDVPSIDATALETMDAAAD